ncbi:MAG: cytochrome b [Labrys sp. (in: a-proteobacteria)]|jgi:cytochrome b561
MPATITASTAPITTAMTIMVAAVATTETLRRGGGRVTLIRHGNGRDGADRKGRVVVVRPSKAAQATFIEPFLPRTTQMSSEDRAGYSFLQILLHWVTVLMVAFQLMFGESMGEVGRAVRRGETPEPDELFLADAHYWIGLAILAVTLLRVMVRVIQGAPPAPAAAPRWSHVAAAVTHGLFYVALLSMPVTGLLAVYVSDAFGEIHEIGKPVLILLILAHVGAVAVHQLAWGDGVLRRMLSPGR